MSSPSQKKWAQPGFIIAVVILAVAAAGLNGAVSYLQLRWQKDPVALTRELSTIPDKLGDWVKVSKDEPLEKDLQQALATEQYVFRDYVDSRLVSKQEIAEFDGKGANERRALLARLQVERPTAVVNLAVSYYTGMVDTVAHIPDRCYIADGYEPSDYETPSWNLGTTHLGEPGPIPVRFINFEDQTAAGRVTRRVSYFFFVNGQYTSNPIAVRQSLGTLRNKHGFYSKVELATIKGDHDSAQKTMINFLSAALPEIEKCMPDWNKVEGLSSK